MQQMDKVHIVTCKSTCCQLFNKMRTHLKNKRTFWIGIVLTIVIFIILYHKFLFEGYAYAYSNNDIGSDTVYMYIPKYYFISKILHGQSIYTYYFQIGFGSDIVSIIQSIFNPFDIFVVLLKPEHIYIGIIISTFFKYIVIFIFSYKFFNRLYKLETVTLICALLWTFCSYIVVWGQHYSFATTMVGFTIFMYYFQMFLDEEKINIKFLLSMMLYVLFSYYFFYSSGILVAIYLIYYLLHKKKHMTYIVVKLLKLLLLAISAIGISAFILLPILMVFFQSARTPAFDGADSLVTSFNLSLKSVSAIIARFISSDLIGSGTTLYEDYYSGPLNYYEFAFLSTSLLSIFGIAKYILTPKHVILHTMVVLCVVLCLLCPSVNYLLCFDNKMRWTYFLVLALILLIGYFLEDYIGYYDKRKVRNIVFLSCVIYISSCAILLLAHYLKIIHLNKYLFILECIFFIFFIIFFMRIKINKRAFTGTICICVLAEISINDYIAINQRGIEKISTLNKNYLYDGTKSVVDQLKELDPNFYRLNKSYDSYFYNDAYSQGYNGVASYDSFNTAELVSLMKKFKVKAPFMLPHYQRLPINQIFLNSLFGVKYFITNHVIDNVKVFAESQGKYGVLNPFWLPFGFLYNAENHHQLPLDDDVLQGDYSRYMIKSTSLLKLKPIFQNAEFKKGVQRSFNDDPQLIINFPDTYTLKDKTLFIDIEAKEKTTGQFFYANNDEFDADDVYNFDVEKGRNKIYIDLNKVQLKGKHRAIRLDLSNTKQDIKIHALNLTELNFSKIKKIIAQYRENPLENIKQDFKSIRGDIHNHNKTAMTLFMPIVYSKQWSAYVDGKQVNITNNHNFMTIPIPKGKHEIAFVYMPSGLVLGCVITIMSICLLSALNWKYKFFYCKKRYVK